MFCIDDKLEQELFKKYFEYIVASDPLLGKIGIRSSIHRPNIRYSNGSKELITPPVLVSIEVQTKADDIRNYNIEVLSENLFLLASQNLKAMFQMLVDGMIKVTDFTGNVVDAKGAKLSMLLTLSEKVALF